MADTQDVLRLSITPLPAFASRDAIARGVVALRRAWKRVWRSLHGAHGTLPSLPTDDEEVLGAFFAITLTPSNTLTLDGLPDSGYASAYAKAALAVLAPFVTPGAIGFLDTSSSEPYAVVVDARGARMRQLVPAPERARRKRTRR